MANVPYVFTARDPKGSPANAPLTGLAPSWVFLARLADRQPVTPPPIVEIGHGQYLAWYDPEAQGEASGQIDLGPSVLEPAARLVDVAFFLADSRTTYNLDVPISSRAPAGNAIFLGVDSKTQGNWRGAYGASGAWVAGDASGPNPVLPPSANAQIAGGTSVTWTTATADVRAMQNVAGTGRIAACWYSWTNLTFALALPRNRGTRVTIYALDWDIAGRNIRFDVLDAAGNVLDTRTLANYQGGVHVSWAIQGQASIRVTNIQGANYNAVVNAIFFD